jgi:hypothetical protein
VCNKNVIFGWLVLLIGALVLVWPGSLVRIAPYYRGVMPTEQSRVAIRSARIGGLLVAAAGLVILVVG